MFNNNESENNMKDPYDKQQFDIGTYFTIKYYADKHSKTITRRAKRGKSMNEKNTQSLLDLINKLITLVGKNVDNINRLAEEIADLKAKR
jgi:hypothetical protein